MSSLKKEFYTATYEEIRSGEATGVYFARILKILRAKGVHKHVLGQLKSLPALENLK
jgi:hypothetical protein